MTFKTNSHPGRGFHMTFANGWTVSVQWREGSYCAARNDPAPWKASATAEVAAWDANGFWHEFDHGDHVKGWQTPDEVATFMAQIASLPGKETAHADA